MMAYIPRKYVQDRSHLQRDIIRLQLLIFERTLTETMELYWSNDAGISRRRIVDNFFSYVPGDNAPPLIAPTSLSAAAITYNKIGLTWSDLSNNETGFEIVRSTTIDGTYNSVGTVEQIKQYLPILPSILPPVIITR